MHKALDSVPSMYKSIYGIPYMSTILAPRSTQHEDLKVTPGYKVIFPTETRHRSRDRAGDVIRIASLKHATYGGLQAGRSRAFLCEWMRLLGKRSRKPHSGGKFPALFLGESSIVEQQQT